MISKGAHTHTQTHTIGHIDTELDFFKTETLHLDILSTVLQQVLYEKFPQQQRICEFVFTLFSENWQILQTIIFRLWSCLEDKQVGDLV